MLSIEMGYFCLLDSKTTRALRKKWRRKRRRKKTLERQQGATSKKVWQIRVTKSASVATLRYL